VSCIAVFSGTLALTRFRTAVRRKSCGIRPGHPAATQAAFHAFTKAVIGFGCLVPPRPLAMRRKNTHGQMTPAAFRVDNATNELYPNHLNYLKDLAPEMGRNFSLVYNVKF
jgi:hypothetical protein